MRSTPIRLSRVVLFLGIIGIALLCFGLQIAKAPAIRYSGDEASSALAIIGIAKTGLPQMPSGLNYWRSPVAHYANGLSAMIFGPSRTAVAGASLLSYLGLLLVIGFAFGLRRNFSPFAAIAGVLLLGCNPSIQDFAYSPRMYMIYAFFLSSGLVIWIMRQGMEWTISGFALLLLCLLAALSHQHFIVFLPALVVAGVYKALALKRHSYRVAIKDYVCSPEFWAPAVGAGAAAAIHFGENYLPGAWSNSSSNVIRMGAAPDLSFVLGVLSENMIFPAWLLVLLVALIEGYRRKCLQAEEPFSFHHLPVFQGWIILILSYITTSIALPVRTNYYTLPLMPLYVFVLINTGLFLANLRAVPMKMRIFGIMIALGIGLESGRWQPYGLSRAYATLVELERNQLPEWATVKQWSEQFGSTIISSDPDVVFLNIGQIHYEARTPGLNPKDPCSEIISDQFSISYLHSLCTFKAAEAKSSGPILYVGFPQRLELSVAVEIKSHLLGNYRDIGSLDGMKILCWDNHSPLACSELDASITETIRRVRFKS